MLAEIERFVNWLRRRNPEARTWRDWNVGQALADLSSANSAST